ncbi:ABC transporter ATP-binding protein [uncultured Solobacterium sp.]|uniref:ABC transporter ATP-binding protein n=1 Tax=uncultured Solobacterium sp. TaxID=747375 RepID=UPI0028DC718D|nr:ABC transporter ATP-binding protein [uncultured Solobacterium sp.]
MKKYAYSIPVLVSRLVKKAKPIAKYLTISTLASIVGNLSHMGVMGFGALWIMKVAGIVTTGSAWLYACMMLLCGLLIALCRYLEGVFSHLGAYGILAKMRVDLFTSINRLAPAYLIDQKVGDVINIAVGDIETSEYFFAHTIGPMFTVILLPVTTVVIALQFNPFYAYVLIPVYLIISIIIPLVGLYLGRGIGKEYRKDLGKLKAVILENIYAIKDIQIYHASEKKIAQVMKYNNQVNKDMHAMTMHKQALSSAPNFFVYLGRVIILVVAAYLLSNGIGDPVGTIVISFIATASFSSTFSLTFVVSHLLEAFAAAERIFLIEDANPLTTDPRDSVQIDHVDCIDFEDVSFTYPKTNREILKHFNLSIQNQEHIGIVGESGSGKSTILRLLLRYYPLQTGKIHINKISLDQFSFEELHRHIAVLEQDTYLFNDTIAQNIAIAKPEATMDEIRLAAKRAGIDDFIMSLADGYDTHMGQMSSRVSGGERQRIGLARIMLKQPDVIILDEPTSALDVLHEKELLYTLEKEFKDKMILTISHRLSTLTYCDRIIQVKDGSGNVKG